MSAQGGRASAAYGHGAEIATALASWLPDAWDEARQDAESSPR